MDITKKKKKKKLIFLLVLGRILFKLLLLLLCVCVCMSVSVYQSTTCQHRVNKVIHHVSTLITVVTLLANEIASLRANETVIS